MVDELAQEPADGEAEVETQVETDAAESPPAKETPKDETDNVQKRIDKLTREKYDARRKADLASYEVQTLKERLAALEAAKTTAPAKQEPTLEGVGYDEAKYQAAMRDWVRAEAVKAAREEAQSALSLSQAHRQHVEFEKRQAEFVKSTPDYIEKVLEPDVIPISDEMQEALKQMDNGPQIAYYLCTNEEKAKAIMALPPLLQAREIGRIEATLEKKAVSVSKAPPPPPKLSPDNSGPTVRADSPESDSLSDEEWNRRRKKQVSRKG